MKKMAKPRTFYFQNGALSGRAKALSQPCRGHIMQKPKVFVIQLKSGPFPDHFLTIISILPD